jgi:(1->4)-alpha-D-glucan 1-alpha-D-glucosylmutase
MPTARWRPGACVGRCAPDVAAHRPITIIPRATYRLQLHQGFGFHHVAQATAYLQQLGISHAYLSPYFKARAGSTHGYDIFDHRQLNPELGDDAAFAAMCQALKQHALGQIVDFVPNHMGVGGADNPLWLDVLEWGAEAAHAGWFDIDWDPERRYLHNKILVPVLGDQYGVELERGMLRLQFDATEGSFAVWAYGTHKLPISPPHYARILGDGQLQLEQLADAFGWLPNWRQQMPQRAAEFKTQLAALVAQRADVREALRFALSRFEGRPGDSGSWRELDELIQQQHWRVAHFRVAADDINYRRFFNINDLAGLRTEVVEVFEHVHHRLLRLVKDGFIDGLRIDHIDGMFDPKAYLRRLQRRLTARRAGRHFYLVVEKILTPHERLRADWPVDGTTGYDFLNQVLGLLIDSSAATELGNCYTEFTGERRAFADIARQCKLHIMDNEMASELNVLARDMARLARQNPRTADFTRDLLRRAIKELIACFPVYRTYIDSNGELDDADRRYLSWALAQARRNETEIDPSAFNFLEQVLTGDLLQRPRSGFSRQSLLRCAMRLQQYSGPVMAKGLEDTAFYRYNRFIALNEVGGDPDRFGGTVAAFHKANRERAQYWPHAMLATATHDTKRGEDCRARLAALSEYADEWARQLPLWTRILRGPQSGADAALRPDRNDEYLLYQLLAGTWPCELLQLESPDDGRLHAYAERMRQTLQKSMREARVHTGWSFPNAEYEDAMSSLIDAALTGTRAVAFFAAFLPFARRVAAAGAHNSLIQTVLKLTAPGVPDIYNGSELWDLSMVDPDNRRPVDYALRSRMLEQLETELAADRGTCMRQLWQHWADGRIKLATIATLLRHRRDASELYTEGDYQPLPAVGAHAEELCAFARTRGPLLMIVAVARGSRRRQQPEFDDNTVLSVPEALHRRQWRELLTGRTLPPASGQFRATDLFADLPAAVLVADVPDGI